MKTCPICDEDPGLYVNDEPFCVFCVSRYPLANVLNEGPNTSSLPRTRNVLAVAAVLALVAFALVCL